MAANVPGPSTSLKGKRKKKMPANPNPLFTQWLQEWKDEANEKGWKRSHTYGKALKTLKLFPLPLESGKDCKRLPNFGDKICKMLDEKLAQYIKNEPRENHASTSNGQKLMVQTTASSSMPLLPNCPSTASSHFAFSLQKRKGPNSVSSTGSSSSRTAAHTVSYASEVKTALKASLETSLFQDTLQIKISTVACNRSVSQQQHDDYEFSVEDTDLDAAIKASLEPNSALASSPTKTLDIAALPKSHSTPVPETNIGIRPLPSLSPSIGDISGSDDSEDDEEMKRAKAESLLSYSQELRTSQSDPSEENKCEVVNQSPKITNKQLDQLKSIDNNESVLVISDDDDNDDKCVNTSLKKESTADSPSELEQFFATCTPDFTLQPGTFDIILCLDDREVNSSKSSCKPLLPDLIKSGVQCDIRRLHIGDLLWIARERLGPQIDRVQGRELVLNYIIERKRMDDLVSSLTDGRMKEQKFRLKHCGLSETIILIEEYGSVQNFSLSEERIKQSIVNSQIIDGFKVKRCANGRDAVSYLAIMTRFLQQNLCNKTLHAVPVEKMKLLKGHQNVHSREQYLAPFTAFNEAAVKHKDLKVTELFAKQLIQVPGVSAERAKAITNVYPTLSLLLDAYKKCNNAKDRENLLATIKYGKNERNLGIAISRMLHMLYTQESLS